MVDLEEAFQGQPLMQLHHHRPSIRADLGVVFQDLKLTQLLRHNHSIKADSEDSMVNRYTDTNLILKSFELIVIAKTLEVNKKDCYVIFSFVMTNL